MEKNLPRVLLAAILLLSLALMLGASLHDSAIVDESAHIPAGYGYVRYLDYRLNPEHPPLVKALAALPLLLLGPNFPVNLQAWKEDVNGQWDAGREFLYESGNDANQIIRIARIMPILLTLLLIFFVYFWARKRIGEYWALLPTSLMAFSPIILAHGHYVTTDVGAASGIAVGIYFFVRYLELPSNKNLVWAGLAFGFAQLLKFSAVLLMPFYGILLIFWLWRTLYKSGATKKLASRFSGKEIWRLILIFIIGYALIVYPIYFLFTQNYPVEREVRDTAFILGSFGGGPTPAGHICKPIRCLADLDVWMARHRLTQPLAQYTLGVLMVLQRSAGGNTIYFLGKVGSAGSIFYFPVVYALKEPLPNLIIIILGLILGILGTWQAFRRKKILLSFKNYLGGHLHEFALLLFVLIYWAYSIHSTLNIGVRHLMPVIPLMYILSAGAIKNWAGKVDWKKVLILILIFWLLAESLASFPYFLSYFNELGGGIWNGYRYVGDSNYDWGQDLLELKNFVNTHPEVEKIAVDYFGGGNPQYYLDGKFVPWESLKGNPALQGIHWLAVSVNTLEQATQKLQTGQERKAQDSYAWLQQLRPAPAGLGQIPLPDYRSGTSIFIYKL
jgi:hypothetical protein